MVRLASRTVDFAVRLRSCVSDAKPAFEGGLSYGAVFEFTAPDFSRRVDCRCVLYVRAYGHTPLPWGVWTPYEERNNTRHRFRGADKSARYVSKVCLRRLDLTFNRSQSAALTAGRIVAGHLLPCCTGEACLAPYRASPRVPFGDVGRSDSCRFALTNSNVRESSRIIPPSPAKSPV